MSTVGQGRPARSRPPLLQRLRPGHWVALDVAAAAVCTLTLTVPLQHGIYGSGLLAAPGDLPVAFVLAAAVSAPLALRRRRPLLAFGLAVAAATLAALLLPASAGPDLYLPAGYVLYLVAAVSPRRVALAALGALLFLVVLQAVRVSPPAHVTGVIVRRRTSRGSSCRPC